MNNMLIVGLISGFYILLSEVANSLGMTTTAITYPDGLNDFGGISIFEMLFYLPIWVLNSFWNLLQLAFFTTDLPFIISSLVFAPIIFMLFYLGIVTVRGGAG